MSRDVSPLPLICFLLGNPRSGTTLLAHLLQQHPDITAPPEPWLMLALEAFGRVDHRHPAGASLIQVAACEFLGRIDRISVSRAFADAAYSQYLAAAGKRTLIDKAPRYWMVLDYLHSLYPEAPHILLLRNPYAIAASLKSTWGIPFVSERCPPTSVSCLAELVTGTPTAAVALALADLVLGLPALAMQRGRRHTQVVHYERLVERPDEEIQRVIAGLGYDPAGIVFAGVEQTEYLRLSSFGDRRLLKKKAVDNRSVETWRTELTIEEMQTVTDLVGADLLVELGYEQSLQHAKDAGIVDRGKAVTEGYRRVFQTWWDLRRGEGEGIPAGACEYNSIFQQAGEDNTISSSSSTLGEAQRLPEFKIGENLQLGASMVAQLKRALMASEDDRATQLEALRNRDAAIEALRREVVRLEQSLAK